MMDKNQANDILHEMNIMLAKEFPNFNVKFCKTTIDTNGKINFKFSMTDKNSVDTITEKDNTIGMVKNDLHPEAPGFEFLYKGHIHRIVSISTRKQKYCVTAEDETTKKRFRFQANFINRMIADKTGKTFTGRLGNGVFFTHHFKD
jgi:hypothetical protein